MELYHRSLLYLHEVRNDNFNFLVCLTGKSQISKTHILTAIGLSPGGSTHLHTNNR